MENAKQWHHVFCHICPAHCARKVAVENGEIVAVVPDKESPYPSTPCLYNKSQIMKEVRSHPDRLQYPLKRVGTRGGGKWERISWDEALDTIAEKINGYKEQFGADSVAFLLGEPKELEFAFAQRFASVFGTANCVTPGNY
ncbi:MAG: molybdopterin-dependent oxidoreductase [Desulfarculus sp.]|nr:molybdopterin-dependent oxidoreductase [Pseudomonadota bacterium]MBU4576051.1 molybdopterin-dependent oxidoreductase [Pseudomonadota bacterium]MBU4596949.1 molybdopterin-dependent oxidoreductase [Pseudomonadota bacterium]MBV1714300.1 molybdopterin-dependent oxidoreductase [Desulfarculus sp.]MBV1737644.1 molybdopterin-dependent oxidoreductase [Desulfarculus sp.]